MEYEYDLTTPEGVFAYFAKYTNIFQPIEEEFARLQEENDKLKADKELLERAILELTLLMGGGMDA